MGGCLAFFCGGRMNDFFMTRAFRFRRKIAPLFLSVFIFTGVSGTVSATAAFADVNEKDYRTIARAIGFLQQAPQGSADFAIVYDPANATSEKEARQLKSIVEKSPKAGTAVLSPRLVQLSDVASLKGADFVFVTSNLASSQARIASAAQAGKTVIFSLDRACVVSGACTVYVNTEKRVEILINKKAAADAGAEFKQVFMVMVSTI
jgi:hypothetical protein